MGRAPLSCLLCSADLSSSTVPRFSTIVRGPILVGLGRSHRSSLVADCGVLPTTITASFSYNQHHCPSASWIPTNNVEAFCRVCALLDKDTLLSWGFDVFAYGERKDALVTIALEMLRHFDLPKRFSISTEKLRALLGAIVDGYVDNPYHNVLHGLSVMQSVFALLTSNGGAQHLGSLDVFGLLLASFAHDLGHPGVNNNFEIQTRSERAWMYNDVSVLENFHCAELFRLLRRPEYDIFSRFSREQFSLVRELIIKLILSTDMSDHFEFLSKFKTWHEAAKPAVLASASAPDTLNPEDVRLRARSPSLLFSKADRLLISQLFLKCSDLSNLAYPWKLAYKWGSLIYHEFTEQGEREKLLGMTPAAFMNRDKTTQEKSTCDFIDFVGRPIFAVLVDFLPRANSVLEQLDFNRCRLEELMAEAAFAPTDGGSGQLKIPAAQVQRLSRACTPDSSPRKPTRRYTTDQAPTKTQTQKTERSKLEAHAGNTSASQSKLKVQKSPRDEETVEKKASEPHPARKDARKVSTSKAQSVQTSPTRPRTDTPFPHSPHTPYHSTQSGPTYKGNAFVARSPHTGITLTVSKALETAVSSEERKVSDRSDNETREKKRSGTQRKVSSSPRKAQSGKPKTISFDGKALDSSRDNMPQTRDRTRPKRSHIRRSLRLSSTASASKGIDSRLSLLLAETQFELSGASHNTGRNRPSSAHTVPDSLRLNDASDGSSSTLLSPAPLDARTSFRQSISMHPVSSRHKQFAAMHHKKLKRKSALR